jgi:hypothetical protein
MAGLFDVFSNTDQQQAANAQIAGINQGYSQLSDLYGQGRGALTSGYGAGASALTAGYGNAGTALTSAYGQGRDALTSNYSAALQPYQQNFAQAQQGTNMLGNALGLHGAAGGAAALQAFQQADPSFAFGLQQGNNSILANSAATGGLGSGNLDLALQTYGQNYGNQQYGNWVNQLQPYLGQANTAAAGIGNTLTGLGSSLNQNYGQMGSGQANLQAGLGTALNANNTGLGTALGQTYGNQGNAAYGAQSSIGNANANAELGNLTASQNMWNAIGTGANLVGNAFGMGGGFSGLSNAFGGGGAQGNAGSLMRLPGLSTGGTAGFGI